MGSCIGHPQVRASLLICFLGQGTSPGLEEEVSPSRALGLVPLLLLATTGNKQGVMLSWEATGANGRKPEPILEGLLQYGGSGPLLPLQLMLCTLYTYIFLSTYASM